MTEALEPPKQDPAADIGKVAAELYAKHREVGEAHAETGQAYRAALADENAEESGDGDLAVLTAEAGQAYRAAGTANAQSLQASGEHFKANRAAYVEAATKEAEAVGNQINGPVDIARQVQVNPEENRPENQR